MRSGERHLVPQPCRFATPSATVKTRKGRQTMGAALTATFLTKCGLLALAFFAAGRPAGAVIIRHDKPPEAAR